MVAYLQVNLGPEAGERFGREPWWYFGYRLGWLPWPLLLGLPWLDRARLRALPPALLYLLALSATPHKEERFLFPVILWMAMEGAAAFVTALWTLGRGARAARRMRVVAALCFVVGGVCVYAVQPDLGSDLHRATIFAGEDAALTGLLIADPGGLWGGPGQFSVGRPLEIAYGLPGEDSFVRALEDRRVNRMIASRGLGRAEAEHAGFHVIREVGWQGTALLAR
jgi:hypothetical protein